jgi:hypothetical protein
MSRGGTRIGAGRKPTSLVKLVVAGEFNAESRAHRRALLNQDLELTDHDEHARLEHIQNAYRNHWGVGPDALRLARWFESVANSRSTPRGSEEAPRA